VKKNPAFIFLIVLMLAGRTAPFSVREAGPAPFLMTIDNIMRGEEMIGQSPTEVQWSYDSRVLYFRWKAPAEKTAELYALDRGQAVPHKITAEQMMKRPPVSAPGSRGMRGFGGFNRGAQVIFDKARRRALIVDGGEVKIMDIPGGTVRPLLETEARISGIRFSFDEKKFVYIADDNLYVFPLENGGLRQMTSFVRHPAAEPRKTSAIDKWYQDQQTELFQVLKRGGGGMGEGRGGRGGAGGPGAAARRKPYSLAESQWVYGLDLFPDESKVIFTVSDPVPDVRNTIVPNYVTRSGYVEDISGRPKAAYSWTRSEKMGLMAAATGEVRWIDLGLGDRKVNASFAGWSPDGKSGLIQASADDRKDEWLFRLDPADGKVTTIELVHDDAWVGELGLTSINWAPDGKSVIYISEKDGFAHLYRAAIDGKTKTPLTAGKFEVREARLSADGRKIYFTSSEAHPGELHYYVMPAEGGPRTRITSLSGQSDSTLSPDEQVLASLSSTPTRPAELYLQPNKPGAAAKPVTQSVTAEFLSYAWIEPEVIHYKARDGADVYARLFKPKNPHPRHPGVIFIHGAGYLQNAHKGWSTYLREYMFHNLLVENGYTILDIDYRGSAGYGRDWRTGIYRHMGGKDLDDIVDGAAFLARSCGVDAARIGTYGGSYGGFLTLMAMFTSPETFKAGAALRPVTDWAHYSAGYTVDILNLPQVDAEAYKKSSPIYFAEGLKGALLICHGLVDTNVHAQDSIRLAQRLIELRKENWELALYPAENHSFTNVDSWADEYKRIFKLFETNLKN
jgi:dipeptidyl aminopeptidase/acylaminoacyl peptidase